VTPNSELQARCGTIAFRNRRGDTSLIDRDDAALGQYLFAYFFFLAAAVCLLALFRPSYFAPRAGTERFLLLRLLMTNLCCFAKRAVKPTLWIVHRPLGGAYAFTWEVLSERSDQPPY
jgi:hypothetical protein